MSMRLVPSLSLLLCACIAQVGAEDKALTALIPDLMTRANVPGLSIALVEDGKISWIGSFGVKNTQTGAQIDDRTVFQAASLSKVVFAYGVLKLVDQGKLDLDTPLSQFLPDYVKH